MVREQSEEGLELRGLPEVARAELEAFARAHADGQAELFLSASRRLSLEYEVGTGRFTSSQGKSVWASARVWQGEGSGFAALPVGRRADVGRVLEAAVRRVGLDARAGLPPGGLSAGLPSPSLAPLSAERLRHLAEQLAREVTPPGVVVQAAVLSQTSAWRALLRSEGGEQGETGSRWDAFVRCETSRGAVVDAVASPRGEAWETESLRARFAEAVEALEGPAEALDASLPLVLRPAVAAPLVAGLAWMLRGDVAASTPALVRAVGKKLFPSVLGVEDAPRHPLGTQHRSTDDEGVAAGPLRLIEEGRLQGFLHTVGTAARLGVAPNGRGLRTESSPPLPSALNLFVVPRGDALPGDYTELVARVETFTTMARPGTVSLVAGGWEVRAGRRVRRIALVDLSLPVLETFRVLRAVGADLTFFPTADGCGTPTLVFPPLLAG
jgi:predicted Zn-dependent protease